MKDGEGESERADREWAGGGEIGKNREGECVSESERV